MDAGIGLGTHSSDRRSCSFQAGSKSKGVLIVKEIPVAMLKLDATLENLCTGLLAKPAKVKSDIKNRKRATTSL